MGHHGRAAIGPHVENRSDATTNPRLPTPRQHALGGYETWLGTNKVEVEASEKIVRTILELLRGLRP